MRKLGAGGATHEVEAMRTSLALRHLSTLSLCLAFFPSVLACSEAADTEQSSNPLVSATSEPQFVDGNPRCEDLELGLRESFLESPNFSTIDLGNGLVITVNFEDPYVSWSSTFPMDGVILKGGSNATVYVYADGATESDG